MRSSVKYPGGAALVAMAMLTVLALGRARATSPAAGLSEVGTTRDACAADHPLRFAGRDGDVIVMAGQSKLVPLVGYTRELIWYCGGTRERCANDHPFNWVRCDRAGNGAIVWTFYSGDRPATEVAPARLGCPVTCPMHGGHPRNGAPDHYGRHHCLTYGHSY